MVTDPEDLPVVSQLVEKPLWMRCPDEGPREVHLWDPQVPCRQRLRYSLPLRGRWLRLCTPVVRLSSRLTGGEAGQVSDGPACPPRRMLGEVFVEDVIAEKGFAKRIDLNQLRPLFRGQESERDFPVTIASINGWRILPAQLSEVRDWIREIPEWGVSLTIPDMAEVAEIAAALLGARVPRAQDTSESHTATLDVPFDLRFSIEEQWHEKKDILLDIQALLQTLSQRKGVSKKPDYDVWKKRFKSHVLSRYGGVRPTQIAELVYPGQRGGQTKVRKDLQLTKSILKEQARRE